jgi:hypothetical protein
MGVADRWADLAVATWSTTWNYGHGWESTLLDAYGIDPDPSRSAYYRLFTALIQGQPALSHTSDILKHTNPSLIKPQILDPTKDNTLYSDYPSRATRLSSQKGIRKCGNGTSATFEGGGV